MDNLEAILAVPRASIWSIGVPRYFRHERRWERPQTDAQLRETEEKLIRAALATKPGPPPHANSHKRGGGVL
jgi:hypothetical protein